MRVVLAGLVSALALGFGGASRADQIVWIANSPGFFNDANNWESSGGGHVVPGILDNVAYDSGRASSPATTVVPGGFSFGIQSLFVSGLNTVIALPGNINTIASNLVVQGAGGGGGDQPVTLTIANPSAVNVGSTVFIGTANGVDSTLALANGAGVNADIANIGGPGTKGTVQLFEGSLRAGTINVGQNSPGGTIQLDQSALTADGAGGLVVGSSGTGTIVVGQNSLLTLTHADIGTLGGQGIVFVSGGGLGTLVQVTNDLNIGFNGGTGTFALSNDTSTLSVGGGISVGDGSGGGNGTLSASAGAVNVVGPMIAGFGSNTGVVAGSGAGKFTVGGDSIFGAFGGNGTLSLKENSVYNANSTTTDSAIFGALGGTGSLAVSDNAQLLSQGTVTIGGASGTSLSQISGSGLLSAPRVVVGDSGNGTLVLWGVGLVGGTPNLTSSDTLTIGVDQGTGLLRAFDAARAAVHDINVATDKGSTGTLSVESDTNFQASGALTVGSDISGGGKATVSVDHATLSAANATIGRGGDQAVLFMKDGAHFSTAGGVTVGTNGLLDATDPGTVASVGGALTVSGPVAVPNANLAAVLNGAELDTHGISIGAGGTGTLFVDGNTSKVINTGTVAVGGGGGTGVLSLSNKASLTSSGLITVNKGGTLVGSGDVVGSILNAGGTVIPGGSPGVLTVTDDYTQQLNSLIVFNLFGPDPSEYDQLFVGGNAVIAGTMDLVFSFTPDRGTAFDLITVGGTGDFSGLTIESNIGLKLVGRFEDGMFAVAVVPEPSTWVLMLTAVSLAVVFTQGRSKRKFWHGRAPVI
jgi:hypothetical protein